MFCVTFWNGRFNGITRYWLKFFRVVWSLQWYRNLHRDAIQQLIGNGYVHRQSIFRG
jgi:hypothetical protein